MNREQRRHPDKPPRPPATEEQPTPKAERPSSEPDPRAKSSGHGKKTADKWNQ